MRAHSLRLGQESNHGPKEGVPVIRKCEGVGVAVCVCVLRVVCRVFV